MTLKINNVIKRPIITEKSIAASDASIYVFDVDMKASKGLIASEIQKLFNVEVVKVRTIINPGKKKRVARTAKFTKSGKSKKAIVQLKEGQKIEILAKE